ncbi:MAG: hypothetical protein LAP85_22500 [Acidobacteriia bacterium]|nr:hypothetical protein [Terriglobia bacterium]
MHLVPAPIKPLIDIKVLEQIDVRVGTIESVSDVPGADKLVKLRVNFGDHTRTILAGMKEERANLQQEVGEPENWIREHRLAIKCCLGPAQK